MHELTPAARLSAWGNAALEGAVSLDDAADAIAGSGGAAHRFFGLAGDDGGVNIAYALGRLRADGARGLRLVLPRPGDIGGLPGPATFNEQALARGEAVLTVGGPPRGVLGEARGAWTVHDVDGGRADPAVPSRRGVGPQPADARGHRRLDAARRRPLGTGRCRGAAAPGEQPAPGRAPAELSFACPSRPGVRPADAHDRRAGPAERRRRRHLCRGATRAGRCCATSTRRPAAGSKPPAALRCAEVAEPATGRLRWRRQAPLRGRDPDQCALEGVTDAPRTRC